MLTNHLLSSKRKRSERVDTLTEDELDPGGSDFVDCVIDRDALAHALGQLPIRERTAVVLKHYLGLDTHEAALAMGVADSTVRSTLSRGLRSLRAALLTTVDPNARSKT